MTTIEGKKPTVNNWNPPTWWRTPEQQLERARQLWPDAVLPEPPAEFIPRTETEVLLLHVPKPFEELLYLVCDPEGYAELFHDDIMSSTTTVRLTPGKKVFTEPVWVAFDPERGKGISPAFYFGRSDIAGPEVFSAMIQFEEWPLSWINDDSSGVASPNLTGYQVNLDEDDNWMLIPSYSRWDDIRTLQLGLVQPSFAWRCWSSPSVREC